MLMSLLKTNALKLAALEPEWSVLGPIREFHFSYIFSKQESAGIFASVAVAKGYTSFISYASPIEWTVTVSIRMEPTATNVTHWEELLNSLADPPSSSYDYVDITCDGWSYPQKEDVFFSPPSGYETKRWQTAHQLATSYQKGRHRASEQRAAVLFGSRLLEASFARRKRQLFDGTKFVSACTTATFDLIPSEFLRRAKTRPPEDPQPTASAFAQWIYSLYGKASGSDEELEAGRAVEKSVWDRRKDTFGCIDNAFLRKTKSDWTLVHNGLQVGEANKSEFYSIKDLLVNGEPLRASPDLVYINDKNSEALIVEIKYSRLLITSNLWPNIWAQLWCYSQIDIAIKAQKATVVGEVWGDLEKIHANAEGTLCLRASVRRDPRAPTYDRFFRKLFQIYCGKD